jgi:hypothetical protein
MCEVPSRKRRSRSGRQMGSKTGRSSGTGRASSGLPSADDSRVRESHANGLPSTPAGAPARVAFRSALRVSGVLCGALLLGHLVGVASGADALYELWPIDDRSPYVVCGLIHSGGSRLPQRQRIARIIRWNWSDLRPTIAAARMRSAARHRFSDRPSPTAEEERQYAEHDRLTRLYWDQGNLDPDLDWG